MKEYKYEESFAFSLSLAEIASKSPKIAVEVISEECEVVIVDSWKAIMYHYSASELADVLALSATKGIISSNSPYYILHNNYIECTDELISDYANFRQAIINMWDFECDIFKPLYDVCKGLSWRVCFIDNKPTSFDVQILNLLVANKEYELIEEMAEEKAWAISWN